MTMRMGQQEYRRVLDRLGLSQERGAEFLGISLRASHGYANGNYIPQPVAMLLRILVNGEIKPGSAKLEHLVAKVEEG